MNSGRTIFASGMVLGISIGFAGGHFALWGRYSPAFSTMADDRESSLTDSSGTWQEDGGARPLLTEPEFLPPDLGEPMTPLATAMVTDAEPAALDSNAAEDDNPHPASAPSINPPAEHSASLPVALNPPTESTLSPADEQLLPPTTTLLPRAEPHALQVPDAQPLSDHDLREEEAIRELVDRELSDAPATQREVWFDSLRDLSKDDAANVLRMWKQFGGPLAPPAGDVALPNLTPAAPSSAPSTGAAETARPFDSASNKALWAARQFRMTNILNAEFPGYKRQVPMMLVLPDHDTEHEETAQSIIKTGVRLDLTPGMQQPTDSPFDWAIDGPGFFPVTDGVRTYYTRNGHWTLDDDGRLVLAGTQPPLRLQVDWTIPAESESLTVSSQGEIGLSFADQVESGLLNDSQGVRQVKLATFLNPAALEVLPNGLFAVTAASGPAQLKAAGQARCGNLRQGVLELSNVDVESEYLAIDDLDAQLAP